MAVYLFEIVIDDDEDDVFCFSLHSDDRAQARQMLALMPDAVYVGELEAPETLAHEVDKRRLH